MIVDTDPTSRRAPTGSGAKQRILRTADDLFYAVGIHTVGVDRLIKDSKVTKATFYKHFHSKDNLVLEYIKRRRDAECDEIQAAIAAAGGPDAALHRLLDLVVGKLQRPDFRGCPFLNAAVEYPEATHPVRTLISAHRDWYTDTVADLFRQAARALPGDAADEFVLAKDGALAGGYAGDPVAAEAALRRAVVALLDARDEVADSVTEEN